MPRVVDEGLCFRRVHATSLRSLVEEFLGKPPSLVVHDPVERARALIHQPVPLATKLGLARECSCTRGASDDPREPRAARSTIDRTVAWLAEVDKADKRRGKGGTNRVGGDKLARESIRIGLPHLELPPHTCTGAFELRLLVVDTEALR